MTTATEERKLTIKDFKSEQVSTWCPGCGDFGILASIQQALIKSNIAPHEVNLVSGIGCGSKLPDYIRANGYMTLHGRGVTIACGAHLANTNLKTIAIGGDGDGFGIGVGHMFHNMRRNMDIVQIVENNEIYGLTKGQYSPMTKTGFVTSTSPEGAIENGVNAGMLAMTAGATFIGIGYSGKPKLNAEIISAALAHKGYAFVMIMQTCPSYQKGQDNKWFNDQIFEIKEACPDYDPTNYREALDLFSGYHKVWDMDQFKDKLYPQGILYQDTTNQPTYAEQIPALAANPGKALVDHDLTVSEETFNKLKQACV